MCAVCDQEAQQLHCALATCIQQDDASLAFFQLSECIRGLMANGIPTGNATGKSTKTTAITNKFDRDFSQECSAKSAFLSALQLWEENSLGNVVMSLICFRFTCFNSRFQCFESHFVHLHVMRLRCGIYHHLRSREKGQTGWPKNQIKERCSWRIHGWVVHFMDGEMTNETWQSLVYYKFLFKSFNWFNFHRKIHYWCGFVAAWFA